MAFRRRNITVGRTESSQLTTTEEINPLLQGVRLSPLTTHPVTSTGTSSLDERLGGHSGLALGASLLVEENGTTDYAGALIRFFAAEGICHGHVVHVVGVGENWIKSLPGIAEEKGRRDLKAEDSQIERMKIAWRYEKLGQSGERVLPDRSFPRSETMVSTEQPFCHRFDLTKRLSLPPDAQINLIPIKPASDPFQIIIQSVLNAVRASRKHTVHRLIIPTVLNPAWWPPNANHPKLFLKFLHALRSLLSQYSDRLTALLTFPLDLYPRHTGLVRWAEILCHGVVELTPFPHMMDAAASKVSLGGARSNEDQPQGMLKIHKLPITSERGEGGAGAGNTIGEDLAFTVSSKTFSIKPFSLPPLDSDPGVQGEAGKLGGKDIEF